MVQAELAYIHKLAAQRWDTALQGPCPAPCDLVMLLRQHKVLGALGEEQLQEALAGEPHLLCCAALSKAVLHCRDS